MNLKTSVLVGGVLIFVAVIVGLFYFFYGDVLNNGSKAPVDGKKKEQIASFKECVEAGFPVMESYPRQCRANGTTFTEDIGNELEKTDIITVDNPRPNQVVRSPLQVTGKARGGWYFEADFPVYLYDSDGNRLAFSIATAEGEWMTEDFVPFTATLTFDLPGTSVGRLVLEKDNPSGLPENADSLFVPVRFE